MQRAWEWLQTSAYQVFTRDEGEVRPQGTWGELRELRVNVNKIGCLLEKSSYPCYFKETTEQYFSL